MTRVGVVLGAGGIVGQAYHAGVLAALEQEAHFDARRAEVIVGTSAGSITGTLLRLGVPATDMAALATGRPLSPDGSALLNLLMPETGNLPPLRLRSLLRAWHAPSPALVTRIARRPWSFRPDVAAMTLVPNGQVDISDHGQPLARLVGDRWPEGLWICAARRADGGRVVFGRPGSPTTTLATAVLASCAIPGYFTPILIDGHEYVDGGIHSPTNADVLRAEDVDVVIISSSMSANHPRLQSADGLIRLSTHRRLEREIRRLEIAGKRVIRLEPGARALSAMGLNAMAEDRSNRVVDAAYEETAERITRFPLLAHLDDPLPTALAL